MTDKEIIVRLTMALKNLRYYISDGGCWCRAFDKGWEKHDTDCELARAVLAEVLQHEKEGA